jgi:hypothetical protein
MDVFAVELARTGDVFAAIRAASQQHMDAGRRDDANGAG